MNQIGLEFNLDKYIHAEKISLGVEQYLNWLVMRKNTNTGAAW